MDEAMDLIAETPYGPGGETLTLQFQTQPRPGWPELPSIVAVLQDAWRQIGVESVITERDYNTFRADWEAGTLPAPAISTVVISARGDWTGQGAVWNTCEGSRTTQCDPELDALYADWLSAPTEDEYARLAAEVNQFQYDNFSWIMIAAVHPLYAGGDNVQPDYYVGQIARGIHIVSLTTAE
jgi:ABC-type transport system substrate-binding protein